MRRLNFPPDPASEPEVRTSYPLHLLMFVASKAFTLFCMLSERASAVQNQFERGARGGLAASS